MKHLEVVAAVLEYEGKYLCMQRGASKFDYTAYKYEFPGGKIEPSETGPEALMRELNEEMGITIAITKENHLISVNHTYPDFSITLHTYLVHVDSPEFDLKEHVAFKWCRTEEMDSLDWAEADKPIIEKLKETSYETYRCCL